MRRSVLLVAAVLALAVVGCSSSDGRTLPPPASVATTAPASAPVVGQPSDDGAVEVFSLTSPAFTDGGPIPELYTCDGAGTSPPLQWASTPPAAELALVVRDPDAEGFVHWVLAGIDPSVQGLGEGGVPEGATEAANSSGTVGWLGPCPPVGDAPHTYVFALHVLPEPLALSPGMSPVEAAQLVEGASSESATLTGVYGR